MPVLADTVQQMTIQTGDAHNFVLAVIAGVVVLALGGVVHRVVGHILRLIVWIAAIGITVSIVYHGYHGTFRIPTHADVVDWFDRVRAWTGK